MEFIGQALRQVVFLLDQAVYSLIPSAYELIFYLANINLATNDIFVAIINRIYLLLGIFMLFKVSFSIMQYIVDPNAFSDKSKGFGKLVTNALVSVVLLAMVPWIFSTAYDLQNKIILSNVIPRVILGDTSYNDYSEGANTAAFEEKQKEIRSMGVDLQFTIFSAFYNLNTTSNGGYTSCAPSAEYPTANVIGSSDMFKTSCWDEIEGPLTEEIHKQGGTLKGIFKYCEEDNCSGADDPRDERNFETLKYLLWWMKDGGQSSFTISYIPIISTIVGGYLLLLLVTFCIDIAVRVFKLMFLQMVAPIAIISYVDPKESASNGRLHNWAIESGKTYVSLFLRLAVIYLAVQIIKLLTQTVFAPLANFVTGTNNYQGIDNLYYNGLAPDGTLNIFVYIFLVLAIFTFAKKLPQMIESIFNIKLSGEMNLNPFKNEGFKLGLGVAGVAATGVAGGIGTAAAAAYKSKQDLGQNGFRAGFSAVGGLATGMARGLKGGIQNKGKFSSATVQNSMGKTMRSMDVRSKTGGWKGAPARAADRVRYAIGASSSYESMESHAAMYDDTAAKLKTVQDKVNSAVERSGAGQRVASLRALAAEQDKKGNYLAADNIRKNANELETELRKAYMSTNGAKYSASDLVYNSTTGKYSLNSKATGSGAGTDADLQIAKDAAITSARESGTTIADINDYDAVKGAKDIASREAAQIRSTREYNDAKDRHENIQAQAKQGHIKR